MGLEAVTGRHLTLTRFTFPSAATLCKATGLKADSRTPQGTYCILQVFLEIEIYTQVQQLIAMSSPIESS